MSEQQVGSTAQEKEQGEAQDAVVVIASPYPPNIGLFNNPGSFPDCDFVVPWLDEPLRLHKRIMVAASTLMEEQLGKRAGVDRFDWFFVSFKAVDRRALIKVLRFCYGETLSVGTEEGECCAVLAALFRLQVSCVRKVAPRLVDFAVDQAKRDVAAGAALLTACAGYAECCNSLWCTLDRSLAAAVLTRENMCEHADVVVRECLLGLPPAYLDLAQYGPPHSAHSEFRTRLEYVRCNQFQTGADKAKVLKGALAADINCEEMVELCNLGVLPAEELLDTCLTAFAASEQRARRELAACRQQLADREAAECLQLAYTRSAPAALVTGHADARSGGAVLDDTRRRIVSVSDLAGKCRDVFVTTLADAQHGATVCRPGLVPFSSTNHAPVHDGGRYVYFMEYSFRDHAGTRFGRLDLDTLAFEELPPLPAGSKFATTFSGCCHHGTVYAVDATPALCAYDPARRAWARFPDVRLPAEGEFVSVRLLADPQDAPQLLYALGMAAKSGLYRVDIPRRAVSLLSAPPVPYDGTRDVALVRASPSEFVVVAALAEGCWHAYSSKQKAWAALANWAPCKGVFNHNYLLYSSSLRAFFYHIHEHTSFEVVLL